jgi:cardiolipin synthase
MPISATGRRPALADLSAPPNVVTLVRLALVPVAVALLAAGSRWGAFWVLAAAVATDGLDGYLARRLARATELGRILDPLADKAAIDAVLFFLALRGEFPWWAFAVFAGRDVAIVWGALSVARRTGGVPASNLVGKAALVTLAAMALAYVADLEPLELPLLVGGLVLASASLVSYARSAVTRWAGRAEIGAE